MATLRQLAERIREREQELAPLYEELAKSAGGETAVRLVQQVSRYQRFQLLSLDLLAGELPQRFAGFGTIVSDEVNLREGPGGNYGLAGHLRQGDQVIVTGQQGYWVEVQVPRGKAGYIFKDYVAIES